MLQGLLACVHRPLSLTVRCLFFCVALSLCSMAAPHVTGAVAVYLETHPTATPSEVMSALVSASSSGTLKDGSLLPGTTDRLLFTGALAT